MNDLNLIRNTWNHLLFVVAGLLIWPGMHSTAIADDIADDLYTWSAELVAFDEASGTVTVKSRVVEHAAIDGLSDFADGDRVMLIWSGVFSASGVRAITHGTQTEFERFTMPVEFVSSEMDGRYISFRVPIPSEDVVEIRSLSPGDWVRAQSPHRPAGREEVVANIRAYNDVF
jgi:hypothetical protein